MARIRLATIPTTDTPPAGEVSIYAKADRNLFLKDDLGVERLIFDSGSAPGGYVVEYFTLDALQIAAKKILLADTPTEADHVIVDVYGAGACFFSLDYTVSGNALEWDGLNLDGLLEVGDVVRVIYN